ncbi:MAG: glycosyltransferase family 4 protein [Planctomycetaceae bacterium]|nr:glycosyltransferase family 4 protein [Planctomycetaceae bacterium]
MRIAYVCADAGVPVFGTKGCSIHVQEVTRAFVRRGDTVDLFVARAGGAAPPDLENCAVTQISVRKSESASDRELSQRENAVRMAQSIRFSDYDLVYERYSLWSDAVQAAAGRCGVPAVLEVNAPLIMEQKQHRGLIHQAAAIRTALSVFLSAPTIIAVSDEVAAWVNEFCHLRTGRTPWNLHVVPNGVDVSRFTACVAQSPSADDVTIGFVGSLKQWHGVASLLSAFADVVEELPGAKLRIIGDGPMRTELQQQAAQLPVAAARRVEFTGAIPPAEMPKQLASLDIAVAPYDSADGFYFSPLKVYEYMACGLAVVASATGQLSNLVQDGINGILVPPGDRARLAESLLKLARTPSTRRRLGEAARQSVVEHHSWQSVLERILRHVNAASRASQSAGRSDHVENEHSIPRLQPWGVGGA